MMQLYPPFGLLEREMFAGKCKTGSKLFQAGWKLRSDFGSVLFPIASMFIPGTYYLAEMIEYLVF